MTTSQTAFLSDVLGDSPIPLGKLAYFRRRLSNRLHSAVLAEFMRQEAAGKINRAKLAKKIHRDPAQVTKWLGASGNWTAETLSDLSLGMGCEPAISLTALADVNTSEPSLRQSADYKVVDLFKPSNAARHSIQADGSGTSRAVAR